MEEEKEIKTDTQPKTPANKQNPTASAPKTIKPEKPTLTPVVDVDPKTKEIKTGFKDESKTNNTTVEVEGGQKFSYAKEGETSGYGSVKATTKVTPKTQVVTSGSIDSGKEQVKLDASVNYSATPKINLGAKGNTTFDQAKHSTSESLGLNANWKPDKKTSLTGSTNYGLKSKEAELKLEAERKFVDGELTVKNSAGLKHAGSGKDAGKSTFDDTLEVGYKPNEVLDINGKLKYSNPPGPKDSFTTNQAVNFNLIHNPNKTFSTGVEHVYDISNGRTNELTGNLKYKIKDMEAFIKGGVVRDNTNQLGTSIGVGIVKHF